jgi:hypothetical protein
MIQSTIVASCAACLLGCNLGPRVSDDLERGPSRVLPAGATVPSIADDPDLIRQIQINDGLSDQALAMSGGVVTRSTGKAAGAPVKYWSFGAAPIEGSYAVAAPLYVLVTARGDGTYARVAEHPYLIDTICGDVRYSAIRRVIDVPVTELYAGEQITSIEALSEAIGDGLVDEPVPDGTWVNLPVVLPGTTLEVGATTPPLAATTVYARGYRVDAFELGTRLGRQPLRNNLIPIGQATSLQTGVATGSPPTLPLAFDAQPVFQYGIPAAPPAPGTFNYTPLVTELDVRLATGVAPAAIVDDAMLFKRSATGSITGIYVDNVATFTVTTSVTNKQIQFAEDAP